MPVQAHWEDADRTILRVTHTQIDSWQDTHSDDAHVIIPLLDSTPHTTAIIVDLRDLPDLLEGEVMPAINKCIETYKHHDIDAVVFVSEKQGIRSLMETTHQRFGKVGRCYAATETLDDARAIIAENRGKNTASVG